MEEVKVITNTDWWMLGATILAGVIAAGATVWAVRMSNKETRKQLIQQQEQYRKEKEEQNKEKKFVVIKPMIITSAFNGVLDKLIMQNDYDRKMLFSGDDGFEFFDDIEKRNSQICRILHIQNESNCIISDLVFSTESYLKSKKTDNVIKYKTKNVLKILRPKESFFIRLANQQQFENIVKMTKENESNEFGFDSIFEYSTEARQRVKYHYKVKITNDVYIEIEKDEIENIYDVVADEHESTVFRNLQDYIPFDRSAYVWKKMGQYQASGAIELLQMIPQNMGEQKDLRDNKNTQDDCGA